MDIFSSQTESLSNYRCVNSDLYVTNLNGISLLSVLYCEVVFVQKNSPAFVLCQVFSNDTSSMPDH